MSAKAKSPFGRLPIVIPSNGRVLLCNSINADVSARVWPVLHQVAHVLKLLLPLGLAKVTLGTHITLIHNLIELFLPYPFELLIVWKLVPILGLALRIYSHHLIPLVIHLLVALFLSKLIRHT